MTSGVCESGTTDKVIVFVKMAYISYSDRKILEEDGNAGLYADPSGRMYTKANGKKIYFTWGEWATPVSGRYFNKDWYGSHTWDFYAAEKRGNDILLITRTGFDHLDGHSDFKEKNRVFEVLTFNGNGELDTSASPEYRLDRPTEVKELKKIISKTHSELEIWAINNESLIQEYINTGWTEQYLNESNPNNNGRFEEWAYYKYLELYPDQPILEGFGVEQEKKANDGDSFSQDRVYAPSKFNKKSADKITNFNPSTDSLEIDVDSFSIDSSATFATGKNKKAVKKKLAKQDFDFLYDEKKGGLYFNENGADKGFGDGGIIAILKGAPDLTSGNLAFI